MIQILTKTKIEKPTIKYIRILSPNGAAEITVIEKATGWRLQATGSERASPQGDLMLEIHAGGVTENQLNKIQDVLRG